MRFISQTAGYVLLLIFGLAMFAVTYYFGRWGNRWRTKDGFLVANREVGWLLGGFSIAASWIWAPALFVSVQMAYQKGLAGIFWFTAPNILSLTIFAVLAPTIRKQLPEGYTLPEYVRYKLNSSRVHKLYLFPYFFYQLMAVTVQLFAGGSLVALLTGIALPKVMVSLSVIVLAYTLISGLEASIVTDFVQLGMIFIIAAVILPFASRVAGGAPALAAGFGGIDRIGGIFDPGVAFSFGIVTSIGLIAGSMSDQSNWQRAFAVRRNDVVKAFVFGSILFGIVPISMSTLGFIAANPAMHIVLPAGIDQSMIGVQTIAQLLPRWAVFLFAAGFLAILSSSFDAGLCAASSLWVADVVRPKDDNAAVRAARISMVGMTAAGLLVALAVLYIPHFGLEKLWWIFNTIAACVMVPTVLTLYSESVSERGIFWGVLTAFVVGIPIFIYASVIDKPTWVVGASLFIVLVSTVLSLAFKRSQSETLAWREKTGEVR
jgi:urea-proton symporter